MNCFREEDIQLYLDNECDEQLQTAIQEHLQDCSICREALAQQRQRAHELVQWLNLLVTHQPEIPPLPVKVQTPNSSLIHYIWPLAVAASLLLFVFLGPFDSSDINPTNDSHLLYVSSGEIDANKPITDQPLIMTVVAPDGSTSQVVFN